MSPRPWDTITSAVGCDEEVEDDDDDDDEEEEEEEESVVDNEAERGSTMSVFSLLLPITIWVKLLEVLLIPREAEVVVKKHDTRETTLRFKSVIFSLL